MIKVTSVEAGKRLVTQVMYEVAFEAHAICLQGEYATGRLAASIQQVGPIVTGDEIRGRVGSDLPYASAQHDGAKVHPIFPKSARGVYRFGARGRPQLRFFWRKVGKRVLLPHIPGAPSRIGLSHPGVRHAKKFLTEPLRNAARRHNMRVITGDL